MRRWVLLGLVFAVLLAVAWWFFLISPRNARIAEEHDNLLAAQQQEVTLRTRLARLQEIDEARLEYEAGIGTLGQLIPDQPLLDAFIDEVAALAESTGVDLTELSPAVPAVAEGSELREIDIQAVVNGEFFEILGFLFGLNDMERLTRVDAIDVLASQQEGGGTLLSVNLSLRLFTLSDLIPLSSGEETTTTTLPGDTTSTTIEEA